jgi:hypothetical protein
VGEAANRKGLHGPQMERSTAARIALPQVGTSLRQLAASMQAFKDIVNYANESQRKTIRLPAEIVRGWLHLIMAVVYSNHDEQACLQHLTVMETLMRTCMRAAIDSVSHQPLLDKAAILPLEVVCLISLNLLQDKTGKHSNISETYSEFLKALASQTPAL